MPVSKFVSQYELQVFSYIRERWKSEFLKEYKEEVLEENRKNSVPHDPTLANNQFFHKQAYLFKDTLSNFQVINSSTLPPFFFSREKKVFGHKKIWNSKFEFVLQEETL